MDHALYKPDAEQAELRSGYALGSHAQMGPACDHYLKFKLPPSFVVILDYEPLKCQKILVQRPGQACSGNLAELVLLAVAVLLAVCQEAVLPLGL